MHYYNLSDTKNLKRKDKYISLSILTLLNMKNIKKSYKIINLNQ